ncbi:MAG TPA: tetratricopeptide repeat protein [Caulobacteraceae bacterium]|nr:tetratricopeptide repeat protein [Caulobacteraceae bacterium]
MGKARVALAALLLGGCSSPSYVDASKDWASPNTLTNEVVFKVLPGFDAPKPDCVAVLPLTADKGISAKEAEAIRAAIYEHLAPRVREVPLADVDRLAADLPALHCAAVIEGKVTHYGSTFLGIVSHVDVGADLKMRRVADGRLIWEGSHIASSLDGGIPIDPISAATSLFSAFTNVRGEQSARLTDDLARRLVSTIPPMTLPSLADPGKPPTVKVATAADWFTRGREALAAQDYARAQDDFIQAIALDDTNAGYRDGLALACAADGKTEDALAAYRMAILLDPKDGFAWYNTGIIEFNTGRTGQAIDAFRHAGDAYLAKGDRERAGQAADRLQEIAAVYHAGEHT